MATAIVTTNTTPVDCKVAWRVGQDTLLNSETTSVKKDLMFLKNDTFLLLPSRFGFADFRLPGFSRIQLRPLTGEEPETASSFSRYYPALLSYRAIIGRVDLDAPRISGCPT